jgi:uncharacterized protein YceK
MRDMPHVTFLLVMNAFMIAFLVMLLNGCGAMPSRYMDRNGDFVSHIASATQASATPAPASSTPTSDQQRG